MLILKRTGLVVLGLMLLFSVIVGILLLDKPSTPAIVNQSGEPLENSIAQIEFVDIGGIPQWLLIRSPQYRQSSLARRSRWPWVPRSWTISRLQWRA